MSKFYYEVLYNDKKIAYIGIESETEEDACHRAYEKALDNLRVERNEDDA